MKTDPPAPVPFGTGMKSHQGVEHELNNSTFFLTAHYGEQSLAGDDAGLALARSAGIDELPFRSNNGRRKYGHSSCTGTFPLLLASVVAMVMLISICSFAQRRTHHPLFSHRRLSADKASTPEGLPTCGVKQQESGKTSAEEEPGASASPELSEPSAKKAKSGGEETQGNESARETPWLASHPFLAPSASATLHAGWSSSELAAADALLTLQRAPSTSDGQAPSATGDAPSLETGEQIEEEPQPSTSTAVASASASEEVFQWAAEVAVLAEQERSSGPGSQEERLQPAGAAKVSLARGAMLLVEFVQSPLLHISVPRTHSFFRLPTMDPGVVPRPFNPQRLPALLVSSSRAVSLLHEVRVMFSKTSLNQQDVEMLVDLAEQLAAHCQQYHRGPPKSVAFECVCEVLGFRFLILDALVSAFHVMRQEFPEPWFSDFTKGIPHLLGHKIHTLPRGRPPIFRHLAEELSAAVATLKTGRRPAAEVVYRLKYALFCAKTRPRRFLAAAYDSWRFDCPDSGESSRRDPASR